MKNALFALLIALAVHAMLAVALAVYLAAAPQPDVLPTLDLSSLELSLTDASSEAPPASASQTSSAQTQAPLVRENLPVPSKTATLPPPDMGTVPVLVLPPDMGTVPVSANPPEGSVPVSSEGSVPVSSVPAPPQAHVEAPPRLRRNIRPVYPKGARQRGEQGMVTLEISVGADGAVTEVRVISSSGFSDLDAAAVKAVRQATFTPAQSGSDAVAAQVRLGFSFRLH